jgi:nicotinamide-nucleotide amidase
MKGIMLEEVFPRLDNRYQLKSLFHKTILTQGMGESFLAESIADWEEEVRKAGLSLAYLPAPGLVKLRLTSFEGKQREAEIDAYFLVLKDRFPALVFGQEEETLPQVIGKILSQKNQTIGTVESCTGGGLAASFVANAGASAYFSGSLLTYTNTLKQQVGKVAIEKLNQFGAVSSEVAEEMARNGRDLLGVDMCISTTGVLGPDGGSSENPIGTVWIGVATKERTISKRFQYGDNRERNSQMAILSALNLARCELLELIFEKK